MPRDLRPAFRSCLRLEPKKVAPRVRVVVVRPFCLPFPLVKGGADGGPARACPERHDTSPFVAWRSPWPAETSDLQRVCCVRLSEMMALLGEKLPKQDEADDVAVGNRERLAVLRPTIVASGSSTRLTFLV